MNDVDVQVPYQIHQSIRCGDLARLAFGGERICAHFSRMDRHDEDDSQYDGAKRGEHVVC